MQWWLRGEERATVSTIALPPMANLGNQDGYADDDDSIDSSDDSDNSIDNSDDSDNSIDNSDDSDDIWVTKILSKVAILSHLRTMRKIEVSL